MKDSAARHQLEGFNRDHFRALDERGVEHQSWWRSADTSGAIPDDKTVKPASPSAAQETGRRMQLREDELEIGKQRVKTGEVEVYKEVLSEPVTLEVPLIREEIIIDRRRVEPRPTTQPIGHTPAFSIALREEQVSLDKQAVVSEEVRIGKRELQETERVSETVGREEARIETEGEVALPGASSEPAPTRDQQHG